VGVTVVNVTALSRLERESNQRFAALARKHARPGEPHAKRRAIYKEANRSVGRAEERRMLFGAPEVRL
jgi:hypothetical protein